MASEEHFRSDVLEVLAKTLDLLLDLVSELLHVRDDEGGTGLRVGLVEPLQDGEDEDRGFTHAGLCLTEDVGPVDRGGDAFLLNLVGLVFEVCA